VLALAGLLAITGSAPAPGGVRPLWTMPFSGDRSLVLAGKTLYLSRLEGGRPAVAAYDLAGGAPKWTAPTGTALAAGSPRPAGDLVLAPTDPATDRVTMPDGEYLRERPQNTVALDAATGRERWRTAGDAVPTAGTGTAVVVGKGLLRVVRLSDGGESWRRPVGPLADWTLLPSGEHPEAIATIGQDGVLSVFGYADGAPRATRKVPWDTRAHVATLITAGGRLAVNLNDGSENDRATVYAADDLRTLWSAEYLTPCGDLFCSDAEEGVAGRDPATGQSRWSVPGERNVFPVAGNRIILTRDDEASLLQLADSRTGRPLGPPIAGAMAFQDDRSDRRYLLRPSVTPKGQLVITRLDLADGAQTTLGTFEMKGFDRSFCLATPGYLACPLLGELHVLAVGP